MLDKIGIIGNTQGVKDSNKPAKKKPPTINHKLPLFNAAVVLSSSAIKNAFCLFGVEISMLAIELD